MTDIVEGLKAYLMQDAGVASLPLAGPTGIYDEELDLSEDINMPAKVVVIARAGGPGGPATLQYSTPRLNIRCYGETPHLAMNVYDEVSLALKNLEPSVWASTYIHFCKCVTDAFSLRDPDTQWPYNVSSWQALAADQTIAA